MLKSLTFAIESYSTAKLELCIIEPNFCFIHGIMGLSLYYKKSLKFLHQKNGFFSQQKHFIPQSKMPVGNVPTGLDALCHETFSTYRQIVHEFTTFVSRFSRGK